MDNAEEVFDVVFPSGNEATEIVHPCEEPFDLPAFSVAAERSSILRFAAITQSDNVRVAVTRA